MRSKKFVLVIITVFTLLKTNAQAGGGMTGGALEVTQIANNAQLVQSAIE